MGASCKGLVLAGGGAKGSYQVGAYRALRELGWHPDIITGTSVGCLNAALFVLDKVQEAEELWKNLDIHGVLETPTARPRRNCKTLSWTSCATAGWTWNLWGM